MKKLALIFVAIAVLGYGYTVQQGRSNPSPEISSSVSVQQGTADSLPGSLSGNSESILQSAYQNQQSNLQIQGEGSVIRLLPDDLDGSRHQKFIIKLNSGQTLLIAHNIDLAPRINDLSVGDTVEFYGEYVWNSRGGVIHWTHHDPGGVHVGGWLRHAGNTYQ